MTIRDGESVTAISTFTQLLSSVLWLVLQPLTQRSLRVSQSVSMMFNSHRKNIRLVRDGEKECGGTGSLYTYRYTVTTRMTPALRWAVMRAILMFH